MTLFKKRAEDKNVAKYLLPYGYMRRHLARVYSYRVERGEFVKTKVTKADVTGFHFKDVLPLGVVMAWQRRKLGPVPPPARPNPVDVKIAALHRDVIILRNQFNAYREQSEREIERLTVENMRMELKLKAVNLH